MKTSEIFTSNLPVGEKLSVKRKRFEPKNINNKKKKRNSILN